MAPGDDVDTLGVEISAPNGERGELPRSALQGLSGMDSGEIQFAMYLEPQLEGRFSFGVFVVDEGGNESNRLTGSFEVGGGAGAILGTWRGVAAGFTVTIDITDFYESSGTYDLFGTVSTDWFECLSTGQLTGELTGPGLEIFAGGSGSLGNSAIQFNGQFDGSVIEGLMSLSGDHPDCQVDPAVAITLQRL